jgi:cell division protein ZapA
MSRTDDKGVEEIKVMIFGAEYVLSSQESEAYTHKIAGFVDQKMDQVAKKEKMGDTARVALMAAFDIADQILRQKIQHRADQVKAAEAIGRLEQYLDGVKKDGEAA